MIIPIDTNRATYSSTPIIIKKKKKTFRKPEMQDNFLILIKVIQQRPTANIILNEETLKIVLLRSGI